MREASLEEPLPPGIFEDQEIPDGIDALGENDGTVSLRACLRVDEAFQRDILLGMASRSEQTAWRERSGKSALVLLPLLMAKRDDASDQQVVTVASRT